MSECEKIKGKLCCATYISICHFISVSVHYCDVDYLCLVFSQGLADNTVIAKVNDSVWDLDRPLEEDCSLQLLKFDDEEAQAVSQIFLFSPCLYYIV